MSEKELRELLGTRIALWLLEANRFHEAADEIKAQAMADPPLRRQALCLMRDPLNEEYVMNALEAERLEKCACQLRAILSKGELS